MSKAAKGDKVEVHYTGTLDDGSIFDSSREREPLKFTLGGGQVLAGFEQGVTGLAVGESNKIRIPAAEAYGLVDESLISQIPLDTLPPNLNPQLGMRLQSSSPDGSTQIIKIVAITDTEITVDANHEMAGKDLNFDLELVKISS